MRNSSRNPIAKYIAEVSRMRPPHIVAVQLKNFTPVGMAMAAVMMVKKGE